MKNTLQMLILLSLAVSVHAQVVPPYHVQAEHLTGGEMRLTWELAPVEGLVENFDDEMAQDFLFSTPLSEQFPEGGYYTIENGYTELVSSYYDDWASAIQSAVEFQNFSCSVEMRWIDGFDISEGLLFRTNGVYDDDITGYSFVIGMSPIQGEPIYSAWRHMGGYVVDIIYWRTSNAIDTTALAINRLEVVGSGQTFDFYINDIYVNTATNSLYESGYCGFTHQPGGCVVQYDNFVCAFDAELMDRSMEPRRGEQIDAWLDEAGRPMDHPPLMWEDYQREHPEIFNSPRESIRRPDNSRLQANTGSNTTDELDDFVEYRIYRDGVFIGATADAVFTDQLPGYGTYEYRVTAVYDPEGESIPSVAEVVSWNAITYALEPVNYVVPYTGGTITYDALLFSELNQPFQNVVYKTFVTMPDQTVIGPTFQRSFTLGPHAYIHIPSVPVQVPANAPPGNYFLHGRLYYQGAPVMEQIFQFDKMGGGD